LIVDERVRTPAEILEQYAQGRRDFREIDISDVGTNSSFRGALLVGADFSHSFIVADFRGADLRESRFIEANVKTCVFDCADVRNADFRRAAIDAATFDGCNFDGAQFEGASCQGHTFAQGELPI
jgi:uncharacterized protein YjbI with pentapeptide repeats